MKPIFLLDSHLGSGGKEQLGGKADGLQKLLENGYTIPITACIPCEVYDAFIDTNDLREWIQLELNKKDLVHSRWEELWDISLRIRNRFLRARLPESVESELANFITQHFLGKRLVVRSSSPEEDNQKSSYAGLHRSYLNISGIDELITQIKKVWASLFSDKALLYRQELNLEAERSVMGVVVQELIDSEISGIVFSRNPTDDSQMVIESVYGLNQGLVDGQIEPDRWIISKDNGSLIEYQEAAERTLMAVPVDRGVSLVEIGGSGGAEPPLAQERLKIITTVAQDLERTFGCPQDIEWTWADGQLYLLQSRPITGLHGGDANDKRAWYLSLTRSYANLQKLAEQIQNQFIPEMEKEADRLATRVLGVLSDQALADELKYRQKRYEHWVSVYWDEFIPFAHGIRLFGEVYNDRMIPDDPYEFVSLLAGKKLLSTRRNMLMGRLAARVEAKPTIRDQLLTGRVDLVKDPEFLPLFDTLMSEFGNPFNLYNIGGDTEQQANRKLLGIILQYAELSNFPLSAPQERSEVLEREFLGRMADSAYPFSGAEILELGRASYRLRDDDNIVLGKMEQQLEVAAAEGRKRLLQNGISWAPQLQVMEIIAALVDKESAKRQPLQKSQKVSGQQSPLRARQLIGQPASPGIAKGSVRCIDSQLKFEEFQAGEILVVDAIDPNMTFVAPLASAIVERRGGMLIHGAIIAREYGIPCVTGVYDLTELVKTGDIITVDGYLGLVTIQQSNG